MLSFVLQVKSVNSNFGMTWWHLFLLATAASAAAGNNKSTRCFECIDLPLPLYCGRVTECQHGMKCVVEEVITTGGLILYNTGCLSETRCGLGSGKRDTGDRPLSKRTDKIMCEECCEGDFCNYQGCGITAMQQPKRGPYCFQCDYLHDPNHCRDVVQCDKGLICMLTELSRKRPDGGPLYSSSCRTPVDCHDIGTSSGGKKRGTTCHSCCTGDFCNRECLSHPGTLVTSSIAVPTSPSAQFKNASTSQMTISTTAQTTTSMLKDICHKHHYAYDANTDLCYAFHDDHSTWDKANTHCQHEGGLLAVIDTQAKWDFLKPLIKQHYPHDNIYIGGRDHGNKDYRWTNGQNVTFDAWSGGEPAGGHDYCMHIDHHDDYEWHAGSCGHTWRLICTIQIDGRGTLVTSSISVPTSPTMHVTDAPTSQMTTSATAQTTSMLKDICHKHQYHYDANSNLCFVFHGTHRTWDDADRHCQDEGGRLAILDTQAKWDFLKPAVKHHYHHDDIFIGGRDHGNKDYRWTNGQKLTFNAWSSGEPDGGHGYCMYINHRDDYEWHADSCGHRRPYICTIQIDNH